MSHMAWRDEAPMPVRHIHRHEYVPSMRELSSTREDQQFLRQQERAREVKEQRRLRLTLDKVRQALHDEGVEE